MPCTVCTAKAGAQGKVQIEGTYDADPVKTCCTPGWLGACTLTTESGCGGTSWGVYSVCSSNADNVQINNTCEPFGACCDGESCSWENQDDCENGGRAYLGDGTSCSTEDICDNPTGECCTGSQCSVIVESGCSAGNWSVGGDCSPTPCPSGSGAATFVG